MYAQSISLAFSPTIGSCHKVEIKRIFYSANQVLDNIGIDMYGSAYMYYLLSFTALECTESGYMVKLTIDSTSMSARHGTESSVGSFSGGNIQRDIDFLGASVLLHISKQGKLINAQGIENMTNSLPTNQLGISTEDMFLNMIKEFVRMTIPEYTTESLAIGQTWDCIENVGTGVFKYVENTQYELIDFDSTHASLSLLSSMEPEESDEYLELWGVKISGIVSGATTGTLKIDRNTGWKVESEWQKNSVTKMKTESLPMPIPPLYSKEQITVRGI